MKEITCSFCGHRFDPGEGHACEDCPLQPGCQLVRCPACGFESVNPEQSWLARTFLKLTSPRQARDTQPRNEAR